MKNQPKIHMNLRYKNLNKLYTVDGMQNVEGVSKDIQKILS